MSEWQPIETAPKDGAVLGFSDGDILVAEYYPPTGGWWSGGEFIYRPTHWMPLPQPPEQS